MLVCNWNFVFFLLPLGLGVNKKESQLFLVLKGNQKFRVNLLSNDGLDSKWFFG
jgi:hypothetical protein